MRQVTKDEWTAALRSGEYEQGRLSLKKYNLHGELVYCCMGVLCDLAEVNWTEFFGYFKTENDDEAVLSPETKEELGELGDFLNYRPLNLRNTRGNPMDQRLAYRNDNDNTFWMIADYIDKKYEEWKNKKNNK